MNFFFFGCLFSSKKYGTPDRVTRPASADQSGVFSGFVEAGGKRVGGASVPKCYPQVRFSVYGRVGSVGPRSAAGGRSGGARDVVETLMGVQAAPFRRPLGRGTGEAPAGALARMHLPLPWKGRAGEGGRVKVARKRTPRYQEKKKEKKRNKKCKYGGGGVLFQEPPSQNSS